MHLLWFKRDLRVQDHAALAQAVAAAGDGAVVPLYILEPELWTQPDMSGRHYAFLTEALQSLDQSLRQLGSALLLRVGSAVQILEHLHREQPLTALYSHQETWNHWTYDRDRAVAAWCRSRSIPWHEPRQNGVMRRMGDRDTWLPAWYGHVKAQKVPVPRALRRHDFPSDPFPSTSDLGLASDPCPGRQAGGRAAATRLLTSFLLDRGESYTRAMSSPLTAFDACSRLSPHLAFGTLSVREAYQAAEGSKARGPTSARWSSARRSFTSRLRWHCHFMQRLEDEPEMEFTNLHRAYDGLRGVNTDHLAAWQAGNTGYPFIDACMRALIHTGWLNFRMRSMLMSFAAYHLWLDWQQPALHLARQFTDYEPGIHFSQVQMQSGTTGMNAVRVYNPIKQSLDQDPDGLFIRRWVPELANMPTALIHTPWLSPERMGAYPLPLVSEKQARSEALEALFSLRKQASHREAVAHVVKKHGSRARRPLPSKRRAKANSPQGELPL